MNGRGRKHTLQNQSHNQIWHQTPLGIVHIISIAKILLAFILGPADKSLRNKALFDAAEMFNQILDDIPRFGQHEGLGRVILLDRYQRRLAKRVNLSQCRRG